MYIRTVIPEILFSFDFCLAFLGRNQVFGAVCSAQLAHKVHFSRQHALRVHCPNYLYCGDAGNHAVAHRPSLLKVPMNIDHNFYNNIKEIMEQPCNILMDK
jgi:hypothetical protein